MGYSDGELANAMPVAERLLAAPALQRFFSPGCYRRAWNEVEFADSSGNLFRIDRLVEDDEAIWVLDYRVRAPIPAAGRIPCSGGGLLRCDQGVIGPGRYEGDCFR